MNNLSNLPVFVLAVCFPTFWLSAWIGVSMRRGKRDLKEGAHDDFAFVLGATLTLLGLIIGFTFSMATGRYDQRKNYEEEEANAIGTEYVRADLLTAADADKVQGLLSRYLDQRILYYNTRNQKQLGQVNSDTAQLSTELWSAVEKPAGAQPTPVAALLLAGMNDVFNSRGYTEASWRNRVPFAAWALLITIAIFSNLLVGYFVHGKNALLILILPVALSISLFLIADLDSPRGGVIRVHPQNLMALSQSLH
jgi:hypothetical protein